MFLWMKEMSYIDNYDNNFMFFYFRINYNSCLQTCIYDSKWLLSVAVQSTPLISL